MFVGLVYQALEGVDFASFCFFLLFFTSFGFTSLFCFTSLATLCFSFLELHFISLLFTSFFLSLF